MQEKSCDNCYFKIDPTVKKPVKQYCCVRQIKPDDNICSKHIIGCPECADGTEYTSVATFMYNGKRYCEDCLSLTIGIEKRVVALTQYFDTHGDYIGNSDDTELEDILLNFSGGEYIG